MKQIQNISQITTIILAGGQGTRLRSVVQNCQKVLAEVGGRPFISNILDQIVSVDCRKVVLSTGYLSQQVREIYGDCYRGINIYYSPEDTPLGTAGALRLALPLIKSNWVLVMNGDSYCDLDLKLFWEWHHEQKNPASIALAYVSDLSRYGQVQIQSNGQIIGFLEKQPGNGCGWINAGIYLLSTKLLETIPIGKTMSLERDCFPIWINHGLFGYQNKGSFLDIGTPESYKQAEDFFREKNNDR